LTPEEQEQEILDLLADEEKYLASIGKGGLVPIKRTSQKRLKGTSNNIVFQEQKK